MSYKRFLSDFFILLLPVFACLVIFYANPETKEMLTLNTERSSALTIYTTNFVHYDQGHLTRNLVYYSAFGLVSLILYSYLGHGRIFRCSLLSILIAVPLISPALSLWAVTSYGGEGNIYGFSAVVGAVIGMFGYGSSLLFTFEKRDYPFSYLFILFVTLYYFLSTYLGIANIFSLGMLLLSLIPFTVIARRHARYENRRKRIVIGFGLTMVYLFFLNSMFPENIVSDGNVVNILGHLVGILLGIILPYFCHSVK